MPPIAVSTIFIVGFVFSLLAALYLASARRAGPVHPGLDQWAAAAIASVLSCPLMAARPIMPLSVSAFGGSALTIAAQVLVLAGLRHFIGHRPPWSRPTLMLLGVGAVVFSWFLFVDVNDGARVVVYCALAAYLTAASAVECARGLEPAFRISARFLVLVLGLTSGAHLLRGTAALLATLGGPDVPLYDRGALESLPLLISIAGWCVVLFTLPSLQQRRLMLELAQSNARVRKLEGILPICMHCKRIRDAQAHWEPLEVYIGARSEAEFTHGICPECLDRHYPEDEMP